MLRAIVLLAAAATAFPQPKLDVEPPQRLIRLNVAATNAKGDPVTDLRATDIQLREDGKARPVAFFRFAGPKSESTPLAPGETAANHPVVTPTLILFDRWNERIMTASSAWVGLDNALQRLQSVADVYIYFLTSHGDLFPVHPLPPSNADLRGLAEPTPAQLRGELDDAVRKLNELRGVLVRDQVLRANTTFRALNALGSQMAAIAGRKNLIWVTHGFPLSLDLESGVTDLTPQVRQLSMAAAQSGIAIYTVDESSDMEADLGSSFRDTLEMFSSLTGGRLYPTDTIPDALANAIAEGQGNYRLAYYSAARSNGRKEHKIRLESSRKGVRLLTREGYFGNAEPDPSELEHSLFSLVPHSPFDASEIGVRVALSPAPSGSATHFAIQVDPADILLEQQDGSYRGQLALLFAFYSHGFLRRAAAPVDMAVNLTPAQFNQAQKDGIDLSQDVEVSRDAEKLRVIVMDRKLYALGSVTVSPLK
ncbi:MAG TPA: VWA domain-containing protein [Bryobacteraceae bacterium]|nr:VWA domain-containing protein [Bryobacteraceae bacterium]